MSWEERELRGAGRCSECEHHRAIKAAGCIKHMHCVHWDHETAGSTPACTCYVRSRQARDEDHKRVIARKGKAAWKPDRVLVATEADAARCQRAPMATTSRCPRCGGRITGTIEIQCFSCGWVQYTDAAPDSVSSQHWPQVATMGIRRGDW